MTKGRKPTDNPIPDLEIEPVVTSKRQSPGQAPHNPRAFELELEGIAQPTILKTGSSVANAGSIDLGDLGDLDDLADVRGNGLELSVAARVTGGAVDTSRPWPTGSTPAQTTIGAEKPQAASVYGSPPERLLETPAYAWLVYRQQTKLKRDVSAAQLRLEQAERERDVALARWVDVQRQALEQDERFQRMFQGLQGDETGIVAAKHDLQQVDADAARDEEQAGSAAAELQRRIDAATAQCQTQSAACADGERTLAREKAKRKRIDIEARAGTGPDASTLDARIAAADRAVAAATEQLELCRQGSIAANRELDAARLELRRFEDRARLKTLTVAQHQLRVKHGLATTEQLLTSKKAEIGRALLALRDPKFLDDATRDILLQHDAAVQSALDAYHSLASCLDSFDRQAVRKGLWIVLGTLALFLLLSLLRAVC